MNNRLVMSCVFFSVFLAGCGGSGADKSGGPPRTKTAAHDVVTLRFASGETRPIDEAFAAALKRRSHGRLKLKDVSNGYDRMTTNVDQQIVRDLIARKLDLADVAARAWESEGVTAFRVFQEPFLITSRALLNRVAASSLITKPLLASLARVRVTGLVVVPRGIRYVFGRRQSFDTVAAFKGARIRISVSPTTTGELTDLGAHPVTSVRSNTDTLVALERKRLDGIETDIETAVVNGYVHETPHVAVDGALFAKVTTLVASTPQLAALGRQAIEWIRQAAADSLVATTGDGGDRSAWRSACGGGIRVSAATGAELDKLYAAELPTYTTIDGDPATELVVDRIGLLATETPRSDPWTSCNGGRPTTSASAPIDGIYTFQISEADTERFGDAGTGNSGGVRVQIREGRYALFHYAPPDPAWPGFDFARDPVEVGTVRVVGNKVTFRPNTSIRVGSVPETHRFELFRNRLSFFGGARNEYFLARPWHKIGGP